MLSKSKWIKAPAYMKNTCPAFVNNIKLKGALKTAKAYVSAIGMYRLFINGQRVTEDIFTPGWTEYKAHTQYQFYDITKFLSNENNKIYALCGNGWAVSVLRAREIPDRYFEHISFIGAFFIEYENGEVEIIYTDENWEVKASPIVYSELYHGETVDLTIESDEAVSAVLDDTVKTQLIPQQCECVKEHERFAVKEIIQTPKGELVLDFGQNLAGYVEIKIKGERGQRVVLSHAEVLDKDGNFYTENMRSARNINTYVLSGEQDIFKPTFTFQGYRYVRIDEYPNKNFDASEFTSVAVYSDMKRTGSFICGNRLINKLYQNILWGQRSNFVDVPTDCPQRDERLGWTADAQVFCKTAAINYNVEKFFDKWLNDLMAGQESDGRIFRTAPLPNGEGRGKISAGWSDAAVIVPWEIYRAYGNPKILEKYYPMMLKWVEYIHNFGDEEFLWLGGDHYGDWLAMDAGEGSLYGATQSDLIASAYFAYSTELTIKTGKVIGKDTRKLEELYKNVRKAFRSTFMKDGLPVIYPKYDALATNRPVKANTQTAAAIILEFGLCDDNERAKLAEHLVNLIIENDYRMNTGFLGTAYLLYALSNNGYADVALNLLLSEKNPSWLFSVNLGATTIWEHWDSIRKDGSFWSATMNSFNHYAYGSVFAWMFETLLGIKVDNAGYESVVISPVVDERIGFVDGGIETTYGKINVKWSISGNSVDYEFQIPQGVFATVRIDGMEKKTLTNVVYRCTTPK